MTGKIVRYKNIGPQPEARETRRERKRGRERRTYGRKRRRIRDGIMKKTRTHKKEDTREKTNKTQALSRRKRRKREEQ